MVILLQNIKFLLCTFKLGWQHTLLLALKFVDIISLSYKKISLWAKIKHYIDQLKIEIAYLNILTL